jgi:glycosyltransferase involved in cell wall biosynthesis
MCPSFFLLNAENKFCNLPPKVICTQCYNTILKEKGNRKNKLLGVADINIWRKGWDRFFRETLDEMIVFSESSKDMFLRTYPILENKIKVVLHTILPLEKVDVIQNRTINIGVLGNIGGVHKGSDIIARMAHLLQDRTDVRITIIGDFNNKEYSKDLRVCGAYKQSKLPELVKKEKVNIIFIPSICPETFSFTTAEAMAMGLPVACFNLGAPSERVIKYEKGLIISHVEAECALNEIVSFVRGIRNYDKAT